MNHCKLLCLDLDGTLLNDKKKITEKTAATIRTARKVGVGIVISTGRPLFNARALIHPLGQTDYIIASNGAVVAAADSGTILWEHGLPSQKISLLEAFINKYRLSATFFASDMIYAALWNIWFRYRFDEFKACGFRPGHIRYLPQQNGSLSEQSRYGNIHKCNIFGLSGPLRDILLSELQNAGGFKTAYIDDSKAAEITAAGISKGTAVAFLAGQLGITSGQIIAIGDSENDVDLLKFAGLGIAMENAGDCIKKEAGFVTGSNNNEGVAEAVERFILAK